MSEEPKQDAFGRPIEDKMVGIHDPNIIAANSSHADAPNRVDEKPENTVARLTAEAQEIRDKIVGLGGKLDGLPEISGMSPADLQRVVDAYEQKRAEVADKAARETQQQVIGAALGLAGAGALLAGADKMLPAGAGVLAPEEAIKLTENAKLPINKELEQILAKAGIDKEPLMLSGVKTDGKNVGRDELMSFAPDNGLPNLVAREQQQEQSGGRQRERA